ncbi:MAG: hypothetical protein RRC07_01290 [Anaerolineae bacterium]|nr:hypothetical protein [Anaerolineae bacterium]
MVGTELGTLPFSSNEAKEWVTARLEKAGMRVSPSFDLRSARAVSSSCTCPYHGSDACDCQLVVLLVYQPQPRTPATVVLHSHQGLTWITLPETPNTPLAEMMVRELLTAAGQIDVVAAATNRT